VRCAVSAIWSASMCAGRAVATEIGGEALEKTAKKRRQVIFRPPVGAVAVWVAAPAASRPAPALTVDLRSSPRFHCQMTDRSSPNAVSPPTPAP
jgi:hypothetical protein